MNQNDLISELLQGLTTDMEKLRHQVGKLPVQSPTDYRATIEQLTQAVQALGQEPPKAAAVDLTGISTQLDRIEKQHYQHPDYQMSRAVQYGSYAFGVLVVLLVGMSVLGLHWRSERNDFEVSDWKWRNERQADPVYVSKIDSTYAVYSQADGQKELTALKAWIVRQEQADATRAAAAEAAQQAKAMSAQADELERTTPVPKK